MRFDMNIPYEFHFVSGCWLQGWLQGFFRKDTSGMSYVAVVCISQTKLQITVINCLHYVQINADTHISPKLKTTTFLSSSQENDLSYSTSPNLHKALAI